MNTEKKQLHLSIMGIKRLRRGLIEVHKMFKAMERFGVKSFFELTNASSRGPLLKLVKHGCKLGSRKFLFFTRISLSDDIIACD
jgi:hypothetical protein